MTHTITLKRATIQDKPVLRNLLELYLHDMSEFDQSDVDSHGCFVYNYLDHYWTENDRHAYLFLVDERLAGFALVNRHSVSGEDRWSMAEFFVMRKYRGSGIGRQAAVAVFDLWPGKWIVMQLADHPGSHASWRKVIGDYTGGDFEERNPEAGSQIGPIQLFDS